MHAKPLFYRRYKRDYKYLAAYVTLEIVIGEILFNNEIEGNFIQGDYILFSIIVFV